MVKPFIGILVLAVTVFLPVGAANAASVEFSIISLNPNGNVQLRGDSTNVIVGDFNGDGKDDFIRQEKGCWDDEDIRTAELYLADSSGDGSFVKSVLTDSTSMKGDMTNLIVADFNGDGIDDFIRQEKGDWDNDDVRTAELYLANANGNGTFIKSALTDSNSMKGDVTNLIVGDFNGDGKDDFIRQEKGDWDNDDYRTAELYLANANGAFTKSALTDSNSMKGDLTILIIGDYNGDGKDDFIRQEKGDWDNDDVRTAELYLANANGNGTFTKSALTDSNSMKGDVTNLIVGDYNGDTKDDFIRQEKGSYDNDDVRTAELYLANSNGNGTFIKSALTDSNSMKGDLTNLLIGDFNGDGKDDFIRQEKGDWDNDDYRTAELYLANENGTFNKFALTDSNSMKGDQTSLLVGDFDGDQVADFIKQPLYSDTATAYMPYHNFDYIGLELVTFPDSQPNGKSCAGLSSDINKAVCWYDNIEAIDDNNNRSDLNVWTQDTPAYSDASSNFDSQHCDTFDDNQWLCYQRDIEIGGNRRQLTEGCGDIGQSACSRESWTNVCYLLGSSCYVQTSSNNKRCASDDMFVVNGHCFQLTSEKKLVCPQKQLHGRDLQNQNELLNVAINDADWVFEIYVNGQPIAYGRGQNLTYTDFLDAYFNYVTPATNVHINHGTMWVRISNVRDAANNQVDGQGSINSPWMRVALRSGYVNRYSATLNDVQNNRFWEPHDAVGGQVWTPRPPVAIGNAGPNEDLQGINDEYSNSFNPSFSEETIIFEMQQALALVTTRAGIGGSYVNDDNINRLLPALTTMTAEAARNPTVRMIVHSLLTSEYITIEGSALRNLYTNFNAIATHAGVNIWVVPLTESHVTNYLIANGAQAENPSYSMITLPEANQFFVFGMAAIVFLPAVQNQCGR
jgi:hypothetical protein